MWTETTSGLELSSGHYSCPDRISTSSAELSAMAVRSPRCGLVGWLSLYSEVHRLDSRNGTISHLLVRVVAIVWVTNLPLQKSRLSYAQCVD